MTLHGAGHSAGDVEARALAFIRHRVTHDPGVGRVGHARELETALDGAGRIATILESLVIKHA